MATHVEVNSDQHELFKKLNEEQKTHMRRVFENRKNQTGKKNYKPRDVKSVLVMQTQAMVNYAKEVNAFLDKLQSYTTS